MASEREGLHDNLELHFILLPFKIIYKTSLMALIMFTVSLTILSYFGTERSLTETITRYAATTFDTSTLHRAISMKVYQAMDWVFFDLTQIRELMNTTAGSETTSYKVQSFLVQHMDGIKHFILALKVLSYRVGIVTTYIVFLVPIMLFVATVDGLGQRSIRRDNIGRESAGIYHRVKYWNRGTTILFMQVFFAAPFYVPPQFFLVPVLVWAYFIKTTFKYYKKYL